MPAGRGGGSSYDDSALKARIAKVEEPLNLLNLLTRLWSNKKELSFSFDPQLPFFIARKNERFEYIFLDLMVTSKGNEKIMNQLGEYGWFTNAMSIVDEDAGTASFIFKLHLQGERYGSYEVNPCKFSYKCFSYELAQAYKLEGIINDLNKQGYDFLQTSCLEQNS